MGMEQTETQGKGVDGNGATHNVYFLFCVIVKDIDDGDDIDVIEALREGVRWAGTMKGSL